MMFFKTFTLFCCLIFFSSFLSAAPPLETWKKPSVQELKKQLNDMQFKVTQRDATEKPFQNEYWNNKEQGLYVDIVSGEPLFSSKDMFDSGTGWPSFTKPIDPKNVTLKKDSGLFGERIEVRSARADSHLGHVFEDGPQPTGQRYCMNSAAMRFIAKSDLEKEGYGQYTIIFQDKTYETLNIAGGCFWCLEKPYEELNGVKSVVSGYTGGKTVNPTYEQVTSGLTGHKEVVQIQYDPSLVKIETLLDIFWRNIDPFNGDGQFCDSGNQYTSALYYKDENQKNIFEKSWVEAQKKLQVTGSLKTQFLPQAPFYPAEEYHQDYYKKNPIRYNYYRTNCGRDQRLNKIWKKTK